MASRCCVLCVGLLVVAVLGGPSYLQEKPKFLITCNFKDKDFDECSKKSLQTSLDNLMKGYAPTGTSPLDPMHIPEMNLLSGNDGPVSINAILRDVVVTGMSGTKVLSHTLDRKTLQFRTHMQIPHLKVVAQYAIKGRILVIPLNGHGESSIEPENMDVRTWQDTELVTREGRRFFKIVKSRVEFSLKGLKLKFSNLFNGLKVLEESTNQYLNNNWQPAVESLRPVLKKTLEDIMHDLLSTFADKVPAEYLIGDI